jgi:hypothetical protein
LPLDDADVTIVGFEFGYNAKIGAGIGCANITFRNNESGEDIEQSFTIGKAFDIVDKGRAIAGAAKTINANTNYGRLVMSMKDAIGGPEQMAAQFPDGFTQATSLLGSMWHLNTTKVEVKNLQTGNMQEKDAIIATAFLGMDGEASKPAAAKPAAAKPAAASKPAGKPTLADTDPDLFAELVELAQQHDDYDDFVAAALDRDDVDGNALAMNAVMSAKAGGVWAAR